MTVKAVVFDMDDTLYQEKDYVISGLSAMDKWMKEEYQVTEFYETAIRLFNSGEKNFIFNKTLEHLNISYSEKMINSMIDYYRQHEPDIHLLDDASWVLNNLNEMTKIGLISDGYVVAQEKKVKALKLKDKFHSIILTDKFGRKHWKPSPVPYEHAARELQLSPSECVYVGDNLNKDFISANKLGWITVHIERKYGIYSGANVNQEYKAHYKINNLKELIDIPVLSYMFNTPAKSAF
jgi:putative hydrolase of the HAD superfamily